MTSRREFLQIGIAAVSAWPLAAPATQASAFAPPATPLPLYKVIYDARFPQSVAFARRAEQLGAAVHAIAGDMTRFWYDDLYHRWQQGPVAIAGLTAHGPLFCFEQLAMDQRMRVVFRGEHRPIDFGVVGHALSGPVGLIGRARSALDGGHWAAGMADVVTQCSSGRAEIDSQWIRSASGSAAAIGSEPLYSWVIAPATRV